MGSTSPQQSQASIPASAQPWVNQAGSAIGNVAASAPNYSNFLSSPGGQNAYSVGQGMFAPGGALNLANSQYSNILAGNYLNPQSNPYLQGVMNTSQQQFGQTAGRGLDQLSSYMLLNGQNPTSSGAFGNAAAQFMRGATQDQSNGMNQMLYGNYSQGMQQLLQTLFSGNPVASMAGQGMSLADLPNTLAMQQMQASAIPAQLYNQLLAGLPLAQTQYGPSQFSQNLGMVMQGLQGGANAAAMYAMA